MGELLRVLTHPDHHPVGLVPEQLDRRERVDLDVEHRARASQAIAQLLLGDPGQHELRDREQHEHEYG